MSEDVIIAQHTFYASVQTSSARNGPFPCTQHSVVWGMNGVWGINVETGADRAHSEGVWYSQHYILHACPCFPGQVLCQTRDSGE